MRHTAYLVLLLIAGCSSGTKKGEQPVPLDKVPEAAMKAAEAAAREHFPELKFHSATLRKNGVYEITGKLKNGKIHDVEVTATGEVVEVE